jgi:hypothetical protein
MSALLSPTPRVDRNRRALTTTPTWTLTLEIFFGDASTLPVATPDDLNAVSAFRPIA